MTLLSDRVSGRDNNLNLMRMLAATAVLVSHSFALATGDPSTEPLRTWLGVTPGTIAVDLFFIISGLLVTQSLDRQSSLTRFIRARFFRIWPGLTVAIVLSVGLLGLAFSTLPLTEYLSHRQTWRYLAANISVVHHTEYLLPGVFADNPAAGAVNGSLWTLKHEVRCYVYLLTAWCLFQRYMGNRWWTIFVLSALGITGVGHLLALQEQDLESSPWRLYAMFAAGTAMYTFRERIRFGPSALFAAFILIAIAAESNKLLFGVAYSLLMPWLALGLAYIPTLQLQKYSYAGDYSYGMYIYAFPVQQAILALIPGCGWMELMLLSFCTTFSLASLSWHLIEKPGMAWGADPKKQHTLSKGQVL
ncbi:acyltransferase family protein [Ideonella sp.]|uniref:acyltransferase family protein n=1 Tax=Ideonella sp. TaxID=1929293 RepID=UPI003BB6B6FA